MLYCRNVLLASAYFVDTRVTQLQEKVWDFYSRNRRQMPWRKNLDPYWIFVSEVMLQQTPVSRVIPKFLGFVSTFSCWEALANSDTRKLLSCWSGLGYNTRAIRLRESARIIATVHSHSVPKNWQMVDTLPGIGEATAKAITTYSYNIPEVFIETNIRRVFIHHFFSHQKNVTDSQLLPFIKKSLDRENPREWYWALMDYGSYLKSTVPNPNRNSKHYMKQSKFLGSVRQVRGIILKRIQKDTVYVHEIEKEYRERGTKAIDGLIRDKIVYIKDERLVLV